MGATEGMFFLWWFAVKSDRKKKGVKRAEVRRRTKREIPPPRSRPLLSSNVFHCCPYVPFYALGSLKSTLPMCCGTDVSVSMTAAVNVCWLPSICTHHRRHYSGTNQAPAKGNVSWKNTPALITDTLSHAYWLSPGGISKISWNCKKETLREYSCSSERTAFKDSLIQRAVL